ncbi:ABC transporter substrate-binding protein [Desulfosporosinus sp. OT]|uniref:ABC transporter substrate-binding protein n=1 Tax=Desulfosporosinus sp. OT TaxID=913865 RepID=UPI000223A197|nr:ABC transporter substrate-binding protein [Desulfosporosinus sp. OT]EGW38507.1 receptor ligand binding region family protein [Desulfosporosinus sp. OT]
MKKTIGKRLTGIGAICLATMLVVAGCGASSTTTGAAAGGDKVVKIGFFGPLSGDAATDGVHAKNGAELAVDQINAQGGVKGVKLQLVAEDDQASSKDALNAVQKLIEQEKVSALVSGSYSGPTKTVNPIVQKSKVPMVVSYAVHPDITKGGDYIYRAIYTADVQGDAMAEYAQSELGLKKFAVLSQDNDYGVSIQQAFTAKVKELGGSVPVSRSFKSGDKDFNPLLTAIKGAGVDAIYVAGYYNEAAQICQQAKQLGVNVPVLGSDGFDSPKLIELGGASTEGVTFTTPFNRDEPRDVVKNFVKTYKEKFKEDPDMTAAQTYDSVELIAQAMKTGSDTESIAKGLSQTKDFEGVTGNISFNAQHEAVKPVIFVKVDQGKFVFVKSISTK